MILISREGDLGVGYSIHFCPPNVSKSHQFVIAFERAESGRTVEFHSHGKNEDCGGLRTARTSNNCWGTEPYSIVSTVYNKSRLEE